MKLAGSWSSLLRGVSLQPAEVRQEGQHAEQINMLPDPVAGLTRRQGSIFKAFKDISTTAAADTLRRLSHAGYRVIEHTQAGLEYITLWREAGDGSTPKEQRLPAVICYNKTLGYFLDVSFNTGVEDILNNKQVSAVTAVGRYIMFATNDTPISIQGSIPYGSNANTAVVAWVRGGAFDRTYTVQFPGFAPVGYTTPSASGTNASAVSPQAIAVALGQAASQAGFPNTVTGSHIWFTSQFANIATSDGGDGTLIRGLGRTIDDSSKLTLMGRAGQIVYVQTGANTGYYLQAVAKATNSTTDNSFGEVIWREAAGTRQAEGVLGLGQATIYNERLYVGISNGAADPTGLSHLPAGAGALGVKVVPSMSGDTVSNPTPRWMAGGQITYMGLFQDRLLIASGAAVAVSAAGDYLNFFRSTVLSVPIKDPFEMVAQGSEDDIMRSSVVYNKNLVLFGDRRQYLISGSQALTPTSANISAMTVYADAEKPVAAGGQIYYARNTEGKIAIHQIQPGAFVDSAESFPSSGAVTGYMPAKVQDVATRRFPLGALTTVPGSPAMLVVRSNSDQGAANRTLYVFSYVDTQEGRKQDAWHRFVFNEANGSLLAAVYSPQGLLLFWVRRASDLRLTLVCDLLPLTAGLGTRPYLDSQRQYITAAGGTTDFLPPAVQASAPNWSFAADASSQQGRFLIGAPFANDWFDTYSTILAGTPAAVQVGIDFESSVTLTNPFARDKDGQAILSGRAVVSRLLLKTKQSSGYFVDIVTRNGKVTQEAAPYVINDPTAMVGVLPVRDATLQQAIGKEVREYTVTFRSRKWLPLTFTGIEWIGQSFNRTQRA